MVLQAEIEGVHANTEHFKRTNWNTFFPSTICFRRGSRHPLF
jgi:hypothetical protein